MVFGFLKNLGQKAADTINKIGPDPDFLEALCAASAYVGAADGSFDDTELNKAAGIINANELVNKFFTPAQVNQQLNKFADKIEQGGRSGRAQLLKELEDVSKNPDMAEAVVYIALDVADQGGIDDKEKTALMAVGKALGQERFMQEQLAA